MNDTLWLLVAYLLGFLSGSTALILMAFWDDLKKWKEDLRWKIKLWRLK